MTVSLDEQEDIRRMDRDGATKADIARELHLHLAGESAAMADSKRMMHSCRSPAQP